MWKEVWLIMFFLTFPFFFWLDAKGELINAFRRLSFISCAAQKTRWLTSPLFSPSLPAEHKWFLSSLYLSFTSFSILSVCDETGELIFCFTCSFSVSWLDMASGLTENFLYVSFILEWYEKQAHSRFLNLVHLLLVWNDEKAIMKRSFRFVFIRFCQAS